MNRCTAMVVATVLAVVGQPAIGQSVGVSPVVKAQEVKAKPLGASRQYPLNDTGIPTNKCFKSGGWAAQGHVQVDCSDGLATSLSKAQDGMIGRDVWASNGLDGMLGFSFARISMTGSELSSDVKDWACVRDNVTGLVWERKTNDGTLHDVSKIFKVNDWPGDNVSELISASNAQKLCGFSDWRLPTLFEIMNITHFGRSVEPLVDIDFFKLAVVPNGPAYWTSTASPLSPVHRFSFNFKTGQALSGTNVAAKLNVMLVRGATPSPSDRFSVSGDGNEVTDKKYGLVWQRCPVGTKWTANNCAGNPKLLEHFEAFQEASAQTGWRLPNVKELQTIYDRGLQNPTIIDSTLFPNSGPEPWNSTHYGLNAAWIVSITDGWRFRDDSWVPGRGRFPVRLVKNLDTNGRLVSPEVQNTHPQ